MAVQTNPFGSPGQSSPFGSTGQSGSGTSSGSSDPSSGSVSSPFTSAYDFGSLTTGTPATTVPGYTPQPFTPVPYPSSQGYAPQYPYNQTMYPNGLPGVPSLQPNQFYPGGGPWGPSMMQPGYLSGTLANPYPYLPAPNLSTGFGAYPTAPPLPGNASGEPATSVGGAFPVNAPPAPAPGPYDWQGFFDSLNGVQGNSPQGPTMSLGAPPWATALNTGQALPGAQGQPSIPFASSQQWQTFLPQEQQAILQTAQSVGIDPQAYLQQMAYLNPEWGYQPTAQYQSY